MKKIISIISIISVLMFLTSVAFAIGTQSVTNATALKQKILVTVGVGNGGSVSGNVGATTATIDYNMNTGQQQQPWITVIDSDLIFNQLDVNAYDAATGAFDINCGFIPRRRVTLGNNDTCRVIVTRCSTQNNIDWHYAGICGTQF